MNPRQQALKAFIRQDIRIQWNQGIYGLYLFFSLLYLLLIRFIPSDLKKTAAVGLLLSDPTVLGFFFSGIFLFMEKELLPTLFVTPLKMTRYIVSRVISFFIISLMLCLIFITANFGGKFNLFWLLAGLVLSAPFFTLAGMVLALKFKDAITFLIFGGLSMTICFLPLLELIPAWKIPVFLPTRSGLQCFRLAMGLRKSGFPEISLLDALITSVISLIETVGIFFICCKNLTRFVTGRHHHD